MNPEQLIHIFDLFGTAVFAVTGALCGVRNKLDLLGVVVFGCTVGVGGGILRDVMSKSIPVILTSDFYATASLLGGGLFCILAEFTDLADFNKFLIVSLFVTSIRLGAMYLKLQLPVARCADNDPAERIEQ